MLDWDVLLGFLGLDLDLRRLGLDLGLGLGLGVELGLDLGSPAQSDNSTSHNLE